MFTEQDDFTRSRGDQRLDRTFERDRFQFGGDGCQIGALAPRSCTRNDPLDTVPVLTVVDDLDGARFEEGGFEIVDEVIDVLDADTEADQILREIPSGADGRIDGGMAGEGEEGSVSIGETKTDLGSERTYDMRQGILIKLLTQPKLTLIPQSRVAPTIRSLKLGSSVMKLNTAPGPRA